MSVLSKISVTLASLLLIFGLIQGTCLIVKRTSSSAVKATIQPDNLPQHVAVMLDGNGRWAKKQGQPRTFGHRNSLKSLREVIEGCSELSIPYLTLYAFSTENWARPKEEVAVLMELFTTTLQSELTNLMDNDIKLTAIGDIPRLPQHCQEALGKGSFSNGWHHHISLLAICRRLTNQSSPKKILAQPVAEKVVVAWVMCLETEVELMLDLFLAHSHLH